MVVLSLFDGMSGGQIALNRAGIKYKKYYASEVEATSMKITQQNYPKTIQLGDITKLKKKTLKKMFAGEEVLLIGGSPCQGFSLAGKMKGSSTSCGIDVTSLKQYMKLKKEGFEFDGQSFLFWEYVRILKTVKPKYFLLENVIVTKAWLPMFNDTLGLDPIHINSSLVSAQMRKRYYWTNIPNLSQPLDKNILLKDVLEDDGYVTYKEKAYTVTLANHSGNVRDFFTRCQGNIVFKKSKNGNILVEDGVAKFRLPKSKTPEKLHQIKCGLENGMYTFRRLHISEREKLQTVPVGYTKGVSDTSAGDMLGNGFTINVVSHIMKGLK